MKKLYEKNEITFAILWIVIYIVGMGTLKNNFGLESLWPMLGLIVISGAMLLFVLKDGLAEKYGLTGWAKNSKALWFISCLNLLSGFRQDCPMPGVIYAAVSMALVGFAEEMIFRGFLFKAMLKDGNVRAAIIVASVAFGLGHIVNLFTGQDLTETLYQVVFAAAVGFIFTFAFYKGGSLLPCILAHSLVDVTSVFAADEGSQSLDLILHALVVVIAAAYCFYLAKRVETPAVNRTDREQGLSSGRDRS